MLSEPKLEDSMKEWEQKIVTYHNTHLRAANLKQASDSQLRLIFGELTAQEIRSMRATLTYILP